MDGTWRVKCYIEAEIEAATEKEAVDRMSDIIMDSLREGDELKDIAEVNAEKIRDTGIPDEEEKK